MSPQVCGSLEPELKSVSATPPPAADSLVNDGPGAGTVVVVVDVVVELVVVEVVVTVVDVAPVVVVVEPPPGGHAVATKASNPRKAQVRPRIATSPVMYQESTCQELVTAQEYIEILGLAETQVETSILSSGADEAMFKLETYLSIMKDDIPAEILTDVKLDLVNGDLLGATKRIEDWIRFQNELNKANPVTVPVIADLRNRPEEDKPRRGLPGRALGGPVMADRPYVVGEIGPELFVPQAAGRIIPNKDLLAPANGGGTRPAPQITNHIHTGEYQETLEATVNGLRAAEVMGF